jgi:hypothetical protein
MPIGLSERYPLWVAFQCPQCTWGFIVGLGVLMTDQQIRQFVECPVHGDVTEVRILDVKELKK